MFVTLIFVDRMGAVVVSVSKEEAVDGGDKTRIVCGDRMPGEMPLGHVGATCADCGVQLTVSPIAQALLDDTTERCEVVCTDCAAGISTPDGAATPARTSYIGALLDVESPEWLKTMRKGAVATMTRRGGGA